MPIGAGKTVQDGETAAIHFQPENCSRFVTPSIRSSSEERCATLQQRCIGIYALFVLSKTEDNPVKRVDIVTIGVNSVDPAPEEVDPVINNIKMIIARQHSASVVRRIGVNHF